MHSTQIPANANSIAIEAEPYVVALNRRLDWARRNPQSVTGQKILAEARGYLLTGRVTVDVSRVPEPHRERSEHPSRHEMAASEKPPCPTVEEIDAIFDCPHKRKRTRCKNPFARKSFARPKTFVEDSKPAVSFLVWDEHGKIGMTGTDLLLLAQQFGLLGSKEVRVFAAYGPEPIVLNQYHRAFNRHRRLYRSREVNPFDLIHDRRLRQFMTEPVNLQRI